MIWRVFALCILVMSTTHGVKETQARRFPEDFGFGASTSAFQVEGGWDADGKSMSMWDHLVQTDPAYVIDGTDATVAADSYHLYKRDVQLLKELGATYHRFSISWPRILPNGTNDYINKLGIDHYNDLINELLANGITPLATMYHWDLPQVLSEQGGWLNEDIVEWFGDYVRVLYEHFGDRVKNWLTINEPFVHCYYGYAAGIFAPRVRSPGLGYYECARNTLLAHARAYHIYQEEFKVNQGGRIAIVASSEWVYAASESDDDVQAQKDYLAFQLHHFMDPIFSENGNYPQIVIDRVAAASAAQGLEASRLRPFAQEEIEYIKGTSDFLALNHYSSHYVYRNSSLDGRWEIPSIDDDGYFDVYYDSTWSTGMSDNVIEHAPGFYHLLIYIKENFNNPEVFITENGFSTEGGLNDDGKVQYLRNYLNAILDALEEGANVKGYCGWSLVDTFEWVDGYTNKFGYYEVDMEDPNRARTARKSALVYKEIISSRSIDYEYNPDPHHIDGA